MNLPFGIGKTKLHLIEFYRGDNRVVIVVNGRDRERFPLRYKQLGTVRSSEIAKEKVR